MAIEQVLKALNNPTRLKILEWLKNPVEEFPPHESGLGFENGVCVAYIQEKAGISQSTASQYMSILYQAELVISHRVGKWTYYRLNEEKTNQFLRQLEITITNQDDAK
jgi:DNA-binding transcriptional ArsR family regulator